jgi:hypothetical protein
LADIKLSILSQIDLSLKEILEDSTAEYPRYIIRIYVIYQFHFFAKRNKIATICLVLLKKLHHVTCKSQIKKIISKITHTQYILIKKATYM